MRAPEDNAARERALEVDGSFIVQAPAGSGKTELLSLRYLRLLSVCEHPEEILAITFTRKAASEMRHRIVEALREAAAHETPPAFDNPVRQQRFRFARQALDHARDRGWELTDNPARLRIQTIDSFCHYLATRIPMQSRLGGTPNQSDEVGECFADAIANTLDELDNGSPLADDIALLLRHLDNDHGKIETLLNGLLYKRDQWLSYALDVHAGRGIDRDSLQEALIELIEETLEGVKGHLAPFERELVDALNHAAAHPPDKHDAWVPDYASLTILPPATPEALPVWRFLVTLLLTKENEWRRTVNVNVGFPASIQGDKALTELCKDRKQAFVALLGRFQGDVELEQSLSLLRLLPDPRLEDGQWRFLTALAAVLTRLGGELLLSFHRFGKVDFAQVSAAALSALGREGEPTDLALALDYRIRHILVDEFQDTSKLQTEILTRLTAGWQADDGRTLFLVGDAMQSVYLFRNANVGIYLSVREHGLGDLPLEPLVLTTNFRSQQGLVDWVNGVFSGAFPTHADASRGAVPFTPSTGWHEPLAEFEVLTEIVACADGRREEARHLESERIVAHIEAIRRRDPDGSIAILVRKRSGLSPLLAALREAGLQWQATDMDTMASLPVIEDLQSLTRALLNLSDRVAWLAVLRAPWVGLRLADLHAIACHAGDDSVYAALLDRARVAGLSDDARARLEDFSSVISYGLRLRGTIPLRALVECVWTLLRGNSTAADEADYETVARYFELLEEYDHGGGLRSVFEFERKVGGTYVASTAGVGDSGGIHLLTMHKAKGLEFDHVVLPGLDAGTRGDDRDLLLWHERLNRAGEARLLLAARSSTGADDDLLYQLLKEERARRNRLEQARLLYIAVTRARKSARLSMVLRTNSAGETLPTSNSLACRIWPQLQALDPKLVNRIDLAGEDTAVSRPAGFERYPAATPIRRLRLPLSLDDFERRSIAAAHTPQEDEAPTPDRPDDPLNETAALTGTLIHQALEAEVSRPGALGRLDVLWDYWRLRLAPVVGDDESLQNALQSIEDTLARCLGSQECAWIFDGSLEDGSTELPVSGRRGNRIWHYAIDRSFIGPDGYRWIVDYKTATPTAGMSEDAFIAVQRALHAPQLANYRWLFEQMEDRPVRTALLLTALPRLVELD